MLDYARNRPAVATRQSSPNVLLIVIAAHVALVAVVMSAKMDLPAKIRNAPLVIDLIPVPAPPPEQPIAQPTPQPRAQPLPFDHPAPRVPTPPVSDSHPDAGTIPPKPGPVAGSGGVELPALPPITPAPVRRDARLLTPPSELRPPYPPSKLVSGEEAVLSLKLTIDDRGRVIAVDPVGRADRVFLDAARRYLIARWRYQPASEDGRSVASSITVTLRFELDG